MELDALLRNYSITGKRLPKCFFEQNSDTIAKELLGRFLVRHFPNSDNYVVGQIREVAAYKGQTDHSSDGLMESAGTIDISRKYNKFLLDVATGYENTPSCVTLRGAAFEFGKICQLKGPGSLTNALKIDFDFSGLDISNNEDLWIEGPSLHNVNKKRRNLSSYTKNCLGYFYI